MINTGKLAVRSRCPFKALCMTDVNVEITSREFDTVLGKHSGSEVYSGF